MEELQAKYSELKLMYRVLQEQKEDFQEENNKLQEQKEDFQREVNYLREKYDDLRRSNRAGLFEDDEGNFSSMRVMSFISIFAAIGYSIMTFSVTSETSIETRKYVISAFLIGAFLPKVIQKYVEKNSSLTHSERSNSPSNKDIWY